MSHVSDFTKDSEQVILDLLNESNPIAFTTAELALVAPTVAPVEAPKNTHLTVQAKAGSGYGGTVQVNYDRLPIASFVGDNDLTFDELSHLNVSDFIGQINTLLGINLQAGLDYTDQPLGEWPGVPQEEKVIEVSILPSSLLYLGTFTLTVRSNDISLSGAITVTEFAGWNLEEPVVSQDITEAFSDTILSDF